MKNGDKYEGFCVDVLKELSKRLKFDYEIFEIEGSTINQNGKSTVWDDVITQLKVGVNIYLLQSYKMSISTQNIIQLGRDVTVKTVSATLKITSLMIS